MRIKTVKECYDRVREEFEIVSKIDNASIDSAMLNVDDLVNAVRNEENGRKRI